MKNIQIMLRKSMLRVATGVVVILLVGGCASIPDVTINYRPVKWALLVTIAHTLTCNDEGTLLMVDSGSTYTPFYSAGPTDPQYHIRLSGLNRFYADADIALSLTDDGRLKSINQWTTGQGEAIAKSAVTAVATLGVQPLAGPFTVKPVPGVNLNSQNVVKRAEPPQEPKPQDFRAVCAVVRNYRIDPDKPPQVSLIQTAEIRANSCASVKAKTARGQEGLFRDLKRADLDLTSKVLVAFSNDELQPIAGTPTTVGPDEVPLTLQRMVSVSARVVVDAQGQIASKSIPVPTTGVFVVPIPKAALFGKQSFSLVLADSGRISSIGYGRISGAASALGAVTSVAGADATEDNIEAAALKAAADLIAQQQRYNNCRLKPSDCK